MESLGQAIEKYEKAVLENKAAAEQALADAKAAQQAYDRETQLAFSRELLAAMGYDFDRGRLDLTAHPFCSGIASPHDVRITTRVDEATGWPVGEPEGFCNPKAEGWNADGSVVDAEGNLWNAQYGGSRVAVYAPDGSFKTAYSVPATQSTCPAFGGADLDHLYCTSATQNLDAAAMAADPDAGKTFVIEGLGPGQAEHRVVL